MIANGHTSQSIASIDTPERVDLLRLWQAGIIGWPAEILSQWRHAAILMSIRNIVVQAAGGKPEKALSLHEFAPEIATLLDRVEEAKDITSQADRLIASLMASK